MIKLDENYIKNLTALKIALNGLKIEMKILDYSYNKEIKNDYRRKNRTCNE